MPGACHAGHVRPAGVGLPGDDDAGAWCVPASVVVSVEVVALRAGGGCRITRANRVGSYVARLGRVNRKKGESAKKAAPIVVGAAGGGSSLFSCALPNDARIGRVDGESVPVRGRESCRVAGG